MAKSKLLREIIGKSLDVFEDLRIPIEKAEQPLVTNIEALYQTISSRNYFRKHL